VYQWVLDGVVYMLLFISIYGHRKYIKSNPHTSNEIWIFIRCMYNAEIEL